MSTVRDRSTEADMHRFRETKVVDLASRPVETARRLVAAEDALRSIESAAVQAIHEYGITQETPDKWVSIGDLVMKIMAPVRDRAREGLKR